MIGIDFGSIIISSSISYPPDCVFPSAKKVAFLEVLWISGVVVEVSKGIKLAMISSFLISFMCFRSEEHTSELQSLA